MCIESSGAELADVKDCSEGILPENEHFKCFATCMLQLHGMMDSDGKLVILDIGVPELKGALENCSNESEYRIDGERCH